MKTNRRKWTLLKEGWWDLYVDGKFRGAISRERRGWVWYPVNEPTIPHGRLRRGYEHLADAKRAARP